MERLNTREPLWEITFDEKGSLRAPDRETFFSEVAREGIGDLFIFSHGWGTSEAAARRLYDAMFPLIAQQRFMLCATGPTAALTSAWCNLPRTPATRRCERRSSMR